MSILRKRRLEPVPHEPSHRRTWRTLWRRCSCGLPAPCVDRLVPAPRLPFPRPPTPPGTADPPPRPDWFTETTPADGQHQATWQAVNPHAGAVRPAVPPRTTSATDTRRTPRQTQAPGEAGGRGTAQPSEGDARLVGEIPPSPSAPERHGEPRVTATPGEAITSTTKDEAWLARDADTAHEAHPNLFLDLNLRRDPHSGQPVRAPAWAAPTVLLVQIGRAGDLTPAQAYRAGQGRSW